MSLVAYNASDESDGDESNEEITRKEHAATEGSISDEDDYETVSSTSLLTTISTSYISETKNSRPAGNFSPRPSKKDNAESTATPLTSLEDLPTPLSNVGTLINEEDELEDEVKPKPMEIENAQRPPKRIKQPVKITIPTLEETALEEEAEAKRKPTASLVKSGLFSLLPPPIHSAKKEINRPLIPYTLSKKAQDTTMKPTQGKSYNPNLKPNASISSRNSSNAVNTQKVALNVAMYGSDSEDEKDIATSNFFSLDSSKTSVQSDSKSIQSETVSNSEASSKLSSSAIVDSFIASEEKNSNLNMTKEKEDYNLTLHTKPELGAVNDAPLDFGCVNSSRLWSSPSSYSTYSQNSLAAVGLAGPVSPSQSSSPGSLLGSANAQYNIAYVEETKNEDQDTVTDDDLKQFMSEKEFHRLSGKRKRGLEQAINFVDANVDDYVDPSEVSKHLTEETEYVSHKNKDNMPTAQQRRKKQITYLAYQAKERELELKNTWAQNRMTKKQTQSKYGF
ncbi:papillary renal cell carcinoma (translocation-associated) [Plakobranchus ocellatus]|uniref:Papillary renal cell carcinoma (Translocation-associated) n=1 Tax=Plakobranchus ocellatus TaxID=259542 RepID=A0AAV3YEM4_9GAST|nr:papillary renal cell carcinoma (translocation-associated) [Plakobranchus ocellatus]